MEKPALLPLPKRDFDCCITRSVALNGFGRVEFETNRYSVPVKDASHNLVIKAQPFRIEVLYMDNVIACHPRCYDRKQDILDPQHYLLLLEQCRVLLTTQNRSGAGEKVGHQPMNACWHTCDAKGRMVGVSESSCVSSNCTRTILPT